MTSPAVTTETLHAAVSSRPRPAPAGALSASVTFAWRALLKIRHVPEQLADVLGIPVLFTVMFTYLFGGALAGSARAYLQFLLPGSLVLAVLFLTVYTGVTLNRDLAGGAFDRFRTLPVWRAAPIIGGLLGDAGRYLLASALVIGLGLAMGFRPHGGAIGVLAAVGLVLLFASCLSWAWIALGLILRTPNAVMSVGFTLLFPLTFVSNIFTSPQTMPGWLSAAADLNPVTRLVTADRGLMSGTATAPQIAWALAAAVAFTVVFAPLALRLYRARQ
jgi:daunorubicin/doxorubicin transport system permease protein